MPRRHSPARRVVVAGVGITHPDKLLWPALGITKLDLARYYECVGPTLLRYAGDRPLTLRPFPRGVEGHSYYLKNAPCSLPSWIETWSDVAQSTGRLVRFVVCRDVRTLVWCAQYNAIEVHPWLSRIDQPDRPDWAVIDLDPGAETPFDRVRQAALAFRAEFERRGLSVYPKLSGSSGMHLYLHLERGYTFETVRAYLRELSERVNAAHPDLVTLDYMMADREGRVLADYAQNARGKSTVAPYSVRPRPEAPVAAPLRWSEVEDPRLRPRQWTLRTLPERLEREGDLLAEALEKPFRLPGAPVASE